MGTLIKGIYKGFKYSLNQMFVEKEPEMEIGGPTDVKHVAHIGMGGSSGSAPSWMNEYKTGNDFATTSNCNSREFGDSQQPDDTSSEAAVVKKKERRKKPRAQDNGSCSSRPSRAGKPKSKCSEDNANPTNIEVV